jgi:hypothetical protein
MHCTPACRGSAADLLSHQWILNNTGQQVAPHWAPPEPAFALSQIPRPPSKAAAKPAEAPSRVHHYKFASNISPVAASVAVEQLGIGRTATWDAAAAAARPDGKHTIASQVSAVRVSRCPPEEGVPEMPPTPGVVAGAGGDVPSGSTGSGLVRSQPCAADGLFVSVANVKYTRRHHVHLNPKPEGQPGRGWFEWMQYVWPVFMSALFVPSHVDRHAPKSGGCIYENWAGASIHHQAERLVSSSALPWTMTC